MLEWLPLGDLVGALRCISEAFQGATNHEHHKAWGALNRALEVVEVCAI